MPPVHPEGNDLPTGVHPGVRSTCANHDARLLDPASRMRRVAALVMAGSILTQVIYPWFPYDLTDGNPPVVLVQALRIIALVAAAALAFRAILHKGGAPVAILGSESATPAPARSEESWTSYPERRSR